MMTLGSLFDGAGTFPFAAQICGIEPIWASEIEPFPIAVTTKRFPNMKHLGDITKINGAEIDPVDIITFGSPCQDLSVAGRRAGLEGERSGLFMEAVRIIKEMRQKTNGEYPTFAIWENVPGAFSSHEGEDFRIVLEELVKVKDSNAVIPRPPIRGGKPRWNDAGLIMGDGYSVGYRVLNAASWGVPQRRRRIFLVADFGGQRAGKILFERDGLSRSFAESRETWQGITKSLAFCANAESGISYCLQGNGIDRADTAGCNGRGWCKDVARGNGDGNIAPTITGDHENRVTDYTAVVVGVDGYNAAETGEQASTLGVNCGMSTGRQAVLALTNRGYVSGDITETIRSDPYGAYPIVLCVRERCGCEGGGKGLLIQNDQSGTLATSNDQFICYIANDTAETLDASYFKGQGARSGKEREFICYAIGNGQANNTDLHDIPGALNCMRDQQAIMCIALDRAAFNQGKNAQFNIGVDTEGGAFTVIAKGPGAVCYAVDCRNARLQDINGTLQAKPNGGISYNLNNVVLIPCDVILRRLTPTECARLQGMPDWWCDDVPHKDTAEYKMWGNGMALPNVLYVMEGVAEALKEEQNDQT